MCTLYPFEVGMQVLKMFKPKRWLDPTAGWGDRLRCAIEYGCEYTGVDSNKEMESAYKAIIADKARDPSKYTIKIGKFQDVRIAGTFDLVFTSPPFFTKEVYEHMTMWKDVEEFLEEFLKPLFEKSTKLLEKGGHLVLYIEDRNSSDFIDLMKLYAETLLKYEGAFYYEGTSLRPYYVWLKE
jgi:tRNA1(Val) A37 N6-methylase TrmN6